MLIRASRVLPATVFALYLVTNRPEVSSACGTSSVGASSDAGSVSMQTHQDESCTSPPTSQNSSGSDVGGSGILAAAPDPCSYASFPAVPGGSFSGQAPDGAGTQEYSTVRPLPAGETYDSGYWTASYCPGQPPAYTWVQNGVGAGAAPVLADPQQLAIQLRNTTTVTTPAVSINPYMSTPDGRMATLKNAHTWFWVDPSRWIPLVPRLDAGPVWAQATITPKSLVVDPGDGITPTKTCNGPGTPIGDGIPMNQPSPTCSVTFAQQTDGGTWPMSVHVVFSVTWTGFDGTQPVGGQLADITSPPVAHPIAVLTAKPELVDPNLPPSK